MVQFPGSTILIRYSLSQHRFKEPAHATTDRPAPARSGPRADHHDPGLPRLWPATLGGQQAATDRRHAPGPHPAPTPDPQLPQPGLPLTTRSASAPSRRGDMPCRGTNSASTSSPWSARCDTSSIAASRRSTPSSSAGACRSAPAASAISWTATTSCSRSRPRMLAGRRPGSDRMLLRSSIKKLPYSV